MNILAQKFIQRVDIFLNKKVDATHGVMTSDNVVSLMPFSTLRLRGRNVNRALRLPLKAMRKATSKFYAEQQEQNRRLEEKVSVLEARIEILEKIER